MTDNEIIKALECCVDWCGNVSCWDCPLKNTGCIHFDKLKETLDLINRQKAEIEELTAAKKTYESIIKKSFLEKAGFDIDPLAEIKAEAYKECIEKVKGNSNKRDFVCSGALVETDYTITEKELDNLLKEMVGDV